MRKLDWVIVLILIGLMLSEVRIHQKTIKYRTGPSKESVTNAPAGFETWDDAHVVTHWVTNVYWITNPPVTIKTTNIVVVDNRDPVRIAAASNQLYGLVTEFETNRKLDELLELTRYLHHQAKQQEDVRKTLGEPRHWSYPPYWTNGIPFIFSNGTMRIFQ